MRFHDLAGNVAEWTHDWYVADLGASSVSDPLGPVTGALRVKRNGYYRDFEENVRAAARSGKAPKLKSEEIGFRCVRTR